MITFTPVQLATHLAESQTYYCYFATPAGLLLILATDLGIYKTEFVPQETPIATGSKVDALSATTLILVGTPFQQLVWQAALSIARGKTASYKGIASHIGRPKAYRAVANALRCNKIAYFVPCHRVLRANNDICGYNWGVERKIALLNSEKKTLQD